MRHLKNMLPVLSVVGFLACDTGPGPAENPDGTGQSTADTEDKSFSWSDEPDSGTGEGEWQGGAIAAPEFLDNSTEEDAL